MVGLWVDKVDRDSLIGLAKEAGDSINISDEGIEDNIYFYRRAPEAEA